MREAIGSKVASIIFGVSCFFTGLIIAMVKGWQLALVALIVVPLLAGSFSLMFTGEREKTRERRDAKRQ